MEQYNVTEAARQLWRSRVILRKNAVIPSSRP